MTLNTSPKTHGEPSIEAVASGLGTLGRYGDNYMVHAAEGETIVPREILEANPGLKEDLFRQMTMMGIENPNRYVVGDQLNSINPITGQPEFFFKKIFRAIKKVVKKAAPIIVPMLGNMILPGIGGLIASGLYTKAQGGSWGDALKAAGMAYLGNVASAGIMGGINAPSGQFFDGFSTGIGQGITAPFDAISGLIQGGSASPFQQGIFASDPAGAAAPGISLKDKIIRQYDPRYLEGAATAAPVSAVPPNDATRVKPTGQPLGRAHPRIIQPKPTTGKFSDAMPEWRRNLNLSGEDLVAKLKEQNLFKGHIEGDLASKYPNISDRQIGMIAQGEYKLGPGSWSTDVGPDSSIDSLATSGPKDNYFALDPDYGGRAFKLTPADYGLQGKEALKAANYPGGAEVTINDKDLIVEAVKSEKGDVIKNVFKDKVPVSDRGMLGKYILGPIERTIEPLVGGKLAKTVSPYFAGAGALGLAGLATGAFKDDPPPPPNATQRQMAAYDAYLAAKARENLTTEQHLQMRAAAGITPQYSRSQLARIIGRDVSGLPDYYFTAAGGGEVMGPGTGTSDSIPARLSDGEFVMTARAVKNAGGGDRSLGAARMYDMMNRFEQGAA